MKELKDFFCAQQSMIWDGILSDLIEVKYRVRQDSILGPIILIIIVGDMSVSLVISDGENVVYADDYAIFQG
jgi:hypothetical protein